MPVGGENVAFLTLRSSRMWSLVFQTAGMDQQDSAKHGSLVPGHMFSQGNSPCE